MSSRRSQRRRIQFSLRGLLISISLFSLVFGTFLCRAAQRNRALSKLRSLGANILFEFEDDRGWLANSLLSVSPETLDKLGKAYFFQPIEIQISGPSIRDADLACLANLPSLEVLKIWKCPRLTSSAAEHLATLHNLKHLWIQGVPITDDGLQFLNECRELRTLRLAGANISDAGITNIAHLHGLKRLDLTDCKITDSAFAAMGRLAKLEKLELDGTDVTGEGLSGLAQLQDLRFLGLATASLTFDGLCQVARLDQVRGTRLLENMFSREQLATVQELRLQSRRIVNEKPTHKELWITYWKEPWMFLSGSQSIRLRTPLKSDE